MNTEQQEHYESQARKALAEIEAAMKRGDWCHVAQWAGFLSGYAWRLWDGDWKQED